MFQPKKWWWGLPPLAALWGAAAVINVGAIEKDLSARSLVALSGVEIDQPVVRFSGRDGRVAAAAFGVAARNETVDRVKTTLGVRLVRDETSLVPVAKPYGFAATREGDSLVLSGAVPSPTARLRIVEAAQSALPDAKIVDKLAYGLGAAPNFGERTLDVLNEVAGLSAGTVSLSDGTLSVKGSAVTAEDYVRTIADFAVPPNGLVVGSVELEPPSVPDFSFSVAKSANRLTLSGFVPSIAIRSAVIDAAKKALPSAEIVDELDYAANAPAALQEAAQFAFRELAPLIDGEAQLKAGRFTFKGTAPSRTILDKVQAAVGALKLANITVAPAALIAPPVAQSPAPSPPPAAPSPTTTTAPAASTNLSTSLTTPTTTTPATTTPLTTGPATSAVTPLTPSAAATVTIAVPPGGDVGFSAARDAGAGTVTLSGVYPDEKAHEDILATARRSFVLEKLVDGMKLAEGAPGTPTAAAQAALLRLSRLGNGKVEVAGRRIVVEGEARYQKAADQLTVTASEGLPEGYTAEARIAVAKAPDPVDAKGCQALFTDLLARGTVLFETGKAKIDRDSTGLLDLVAATAQRCPTSAIEVDGHTDKDGTPDTNLALSKDRAQAVVSWLVDAGVDARRLTAAGFGETKPIAPNDTEEGKAKNRRIEFTVK